MVGVALEVEVRAIRDAPELAPAEWEHELDVRGALAVVRKLLFLVLAQADARVVHAESKQELVAIIFPEMIPLEVGAGRAEELQLHLLKLADAEDEVAWRDLVAEGFTDLRDTERQFLARGAQHVFEVDKDALRGFGTEVELRRGVLGDALERLEHQIKLADAREVGLSALRADDAFFFDERFHLRVRPAIGMHIRQALLGNIVLDELVGAEARTAALAVHQRVGKSADVAARDPCFRVHQDRRVHADVVGRLLHKFSPPGALDVILKFHAERAVVPAVGETAIDLAAGVDKAAPFAERYDRIHRIPGRFFRLRCHVTICSLFVSHRILSQEYSFFVKADRG